MSLRERITLKSRQLGQGMTEYIVITALVALAAIGAFNFFGESVQVATTGMSTELLGQDGNAALATQRGLTAAEKANAEKDNGLGNFGQDNAHN